MQTNRFIPKSIRMIAGNSRSTAISEIQILEIYCSLVRVHLLFLLVHTLTSRIDMHVCGTCINRTQRKRRARPRALHFCTRVPHLQ